MTSKQVRALRQRLAEVRQRLAEAVESNEPVATLEEHQKRRDVLEGMLRRLGRRRSLLWSAAAIAIALVAAVVLRYGFRLDRVGVVLNAETTAFTFVNGPAQLRLNPAAIAATEIISSESALRWCMESGGVPQVPCEVVKSPRVNALLANANAAATVRTTGSCFELAVSRGSVQVLATAFAVPVVGASPARPVVLPRSVTLTPGHVIRACTNRGTVLQLNGVTSIIVGERSGGAIAEYESYPALSRGTLFLDDVNESIELRRTDVPRLGGLVDSALIARVSDSIELSLLAEASAITIDSRSDRSAMPSWLDWLASNPGVQGALAIAAAIVASAVALRQRLLEEIT
jgi:hypothetical protein